MEPSESVNSNYRIQIEPSRGTEIEVMELLRGKGVRSKGLEVDVMAIEKTLRAFKGRFVATLLDSLGHSDGSITVGISSDSPAAHISEVEALLGPVKSEYTDLSFRIYEG